MLRFEWFTTQPITQPVYTGIDQLNGVVTQVIIQQDYPSAFSFGNLVVFIYLTGVMIFAVKFIWQLLSLFKILKRADSGVAFSFFNQKRIDNLLPQFQTISMHEDVHIRQLHSADIVFFEVLGVFTWFNPFTYFYKRAIKSIHEYLADEEAAKFQGDKQQYGLLLLSSTFDVPISALSNSFFNKSLIKKRIYMLYKERSRKTAILKYGLFVPLFALALIMSSATIRNNKNIQDIADKLPVTAPLATLKTVIDEAVVNTKSLTAPALNKSQFGENEAKADAPTHEKSITQAEPNWDKFYRYIQMLSKYPLVAQAKKIQGTTMVKFTITGGALENVGIAAKLGGGCDEEVMRLIVSFPGYSGAADGNYTLKVKFTLTGSTTPLLNESIASLKGYTALAEVTIVGYLRDEGPDAIMDFVSIDKQPGFPGGMKGFYDYLSKNVKYPAEALKNKIQGKVHLSYIVEKDGKLSDIKVERALGGGTDEEAVRVLRESPRWIPGEQNGKPVRVKYNIPISFSLAKKP
jgi:TonB family protein